MTFPLPSSTGTSPSLVSGDNERLKPGMTASPSAPAPSSGGSAPITWWDRIEDEFRNIAEGVKDFFSDPCLVRRRTGTASSICGTPSPAGKPTASPAGTPGTGSEKINSTEPSESGLNWYMKMTLGLLLTRSEDSGQAKAGLELFLDGLAGMSEKH